MVKKMWRQLIMLAVIAVVALQYGVALAGPVEWT